MHSRSIRLAVVTAGVTVLIAAFGPPASAGVSGTDAAAVTRYTVTDLGTLGTGDASSAADVNNAGEVVGSVAVRPFETHGFKWIGGVMTDLGTLTGGATSRANAVNDAGQIAGTADRHSGGFGYPVRWNATGAITDLGGPLENALGEGNGIDPAGRVVGGQRPASSEGNPLGTLYQVDGTRVDLGDVGSAQDINARGQVVGGFPAYVWRNGVLTRLPGLTSGGGAFANAINVRGDVVGFAFTATGASTAVRWRNGRVEELGGLDSQSNSANDINAAGQIVGTSGADCVPCPRPRAWVAQAGTLQALDGLIPVSAGWTFESANGINDRGQIVGAGTHNGHPRAFLLTPVFSAIVNFQPAGATTPVGYRADTGAVFGSRGGGMTFGWNVANGANTRDRNAALSPDQRYDTLTHMQKPGGGTRWEIAVPNGLYLVHAVAGDPVATDSTFRITVEGVLAVSGTPSASRHWIEGTVQVNVTDGRITVANGTGAVNNKLNYVDVIGV
jgi:probable HAF family extracellular repeat protein